jgi:hypothetical protein
VKPITLNLLAEEQQAEQASAHDPVKYAIAIGVGILVITAAAGALMMMWAGNKKATADRLQKRWEELTTTQTEGSFRPLKLLAEDFIAIHCQRALFAPELARFKDLVLSSMLLTRMSFRLNMETISAPPPSVATDGSPAKTAGRAKIVEQLFLRLDGTVTDARPELEVDKFLQVIREDSGLSNQLKTVTLRSIGRVGSSSADGDGKSPAAQFVIECGYKEVK